MTEQKEEEPWTAPADQTERERERERDNSTHTRRVNGRIVLTFIVVIRSSLHLKSLSFSLNPSESLW